MTDRDVLVELARVRVIFQMRALAAVMGLPAIADRSGEADETRRGSAVGESGGSRSEIAQTSAPKDSK